jgi:hypothetical protein
MTIGRKPPMSFAIANNLLTPSTEATYLRISPQTTVTTIWNNFEKHEDGFSSMMYPGKFAN